MRPVGLTQILGLMALILATACSKTESNSEFPFEVLVRGPNGKGIENVTISLDKKVIGRSNKVGGFLFDVFGREGELHQISIACPHGYETNEDSTRFRLQRYSTVDEQGKVSAIRHSFRCFPTSIKVAIVVDTKGFGNLPVLIDGEVQDTTNENGIAHLVLDAAPSQEISIMLNTGDHPNLSPQNPVHTFQIGQVAAIHSFEQNFQLPKKHTRKKQRKSFRPRRIPMPIR